MLQNPLQTHDLMLFSCSFRLQSHYRRALALSGLGRIEESFVAYCVSICLDKRSENLTNSLRYDLSRVSCDFFSFSVLFLFSCSVAAENLNLQRDLAFLLKFNHFLFMTSIDAKILNSDCMIFCSQVKIKI